MSAKNNINEKITDVSYERDLSQKLQSLTDSISVPEELNEENVLNLLLKEDSKIREKKFKRQKFSKYLGIAAAILVFAPVIFAMCLNSVGIMGVKYKEGRLCVTQSALKTQKTENGFEIIQSYNRLYHFYDRINWAEKVNVKLKQSFLYKTDAPSYSDGDKPDIQIGIPGMHETINETVYLEPDGQTYGVQSGEKVLIYDEYIISYCDINSEDNNCISIIKTDKKETKKVAEITDIQKEYGNNAIVLYMYKYNEMLVVLCQISVEDSIETQTIIYNLSNPNQPEKVVSLKMNGELEYSRIKDGYLYTFTKTVKNIKEDISPQVNGKEISEKDIYVGNMRWGEGYFFEKIAYNIVSVLDLKNPKGYKSSVAIMSNNTQDSYFGENSLYLFYLTDGNMRILRFGIDDGEIEAEYATDISSKYYHNIRCISEYGDKLRIVVDEKISPGEDIKNDFHKYTMSIYVLDDKFNEIGSIYNFLNDIHYDRQTPIGTVDMFGDMAILLLDNVLYHIDMSEPATMTLINDGKIGTNFNRTQSITNNLFVNFGYISDAGDHYHRMNIMKIQENGLSKNYTVELEDESNYYRYNSEEGTPLLYIGEKGILGIYVSKDIKDNSTDKNLHSFILYTITDEGVEFYKSIDLGNCGKEASKYTNITAIYKDGYIYIVIPGQKVIVEEL